MSKNPDIQTRQVLIEKFKPFTIQNVQAWRKNFAGDLIKVATDCPYIPHKVVTPTLLSIGYKYPKYHRVNFGHPLWGQSKIKMLYHCIAELKITNLESVVYRCTPPERYNPRGCYSFQIFCKYR
jgi:hypothetical protein